MYLSDVLPTWFPCILAPIEFSPDSNSRPLYNSLPGIIRDTSAIWEQAQDLGIAINMKKGEILYPDEKKVPPLIYVQTGKIAINYVDRDGQEFVAHFVMPRALCYEGFWCVSGQLRPMPIRVMEDSRLIFFDSSFTGLELAKAHPLLLDNILYSQAIKNFTYSYLRLINSYKTPVVKVARFILAMRGLRHSSRIPSGLTQRELSSLLHMHTVTFAHAISRLKSLGAIKSLTKTCLELGDTDVLRKIAQPVAMD